MSTKKKMLEAAAGAAAAGGPLAIEDVFSTYLYTGTGSAQTITNGIDLAGEGGLVWTKRRNGTVRTHILVDTERGAEKVLNTDGAYAEYTMTNMPSSFNSDGHTIGTADGGVNESNLNYASWTFRKAPGFFDVVTWTGDGVAGREIAHNLGCVPGFIITKEYDNTTNWSCYHSGLGATKRILLNTTGSSQTSTNYWNDTEPTSTHFTVGSGTAANRSGGSYIAYLFADGDDAAAQIFGTDGDQAVVKCGSYTGTGANDNAIDVGFEPQWLLWKPSSTTGDWQLVDNMRGFTASGVGVNRLEPNTSDAEAVSGTPYCDISSTGFVQHGTSSSNNGSGQTYIYIAIRRPMKTPESGTEVFAIDTQNSTGDGEYPIFRSGFPVDMALFKYTTGTASFNGARLISGNYLKFDTTDAEAYDGNWDDWDYNNGWLDYTLSAQSSYYSWMFKRSPGFFDVVCYTGNGTAGRTVPHNLGVAPEMMWVKRRNSANSWAVYHNGINVDGDGLPETDDINLNTTAAAGDQVLSWNDTPPTETQFTVGNGNEVNNSSGTYIAYLFATLPGVSKVGSYTGNGTSQTIDCGFSSGARFVLIKRTDSTGDWHIWDTERGIVSGNDPFLELNTTNAENSSYDSVDPDSSGFIVNQDAGTNINVSSATYIYLAIA